MKFNLSDEQLRKILSGEYDRMNRLEDIHSMLAEFLARFLLQARAAEREDRPQKDPITPVVVPTLPRTSPRPEKLKK